MTFGGEGRKHAELLGVRSPGMAQLAAARGLKGQQAGCGETALSPGTQASLLSSRGCWQNPASCSCWAEVPAFLVAAHRGLL